MSKRWAMTMLVGSAALAWAPAARAFQIKDPIHGNCHETITANAFAQIGYPSYAPPAVALTHDQQAFLDQQDYDYTYDRNMQMAALITGMRFNDLSGAGDFTFDSLAPVHNNPDDQLEHCLRAHGDVGEQGNASALQACRDYIARELDAALKGLGPDGRIDPGITEPVTVHLRYQGDVQFPLSTFYFHAGRGLHAIQDSFAHSFRDPTWHRITHLFNWVDQVRGDLDEPVNGHGHEKELDDCYSARPSRDGQVAAAERASVEYLSAIMSSGNTDQKHALLNTFFQDWMTYQPGCNVNNAYCNNAVYGELVDRWSKDYPTKQSQQGGCQSAGGALSLLALAGALALWLRRRRLATALGVIMGAIFFARPALADDPPGPRYLAHVGASFDKPGFAYGAGVLWQWTRWEAGIEAEHNPWISIDHGGSIGSGSLNVYAKGGWRHELSPSFSYRAGLDLGTATLLFDTVGSSPGTTGFFLGLEPLSVIYHPAGRFEYEVSGMSLQWPVVQLRGWPFGWPQYRFTFAMRFR